jgi:hypothetical protein
MLGAAVVAAQAEEAVPEHAAAQKVRELAEDEAWERAFARVGVGEEDREVLANDLVQKGLLGIAGSVREGRARVRMRHARAVKGK